jgi:hypothetical protein
MLVRPGCKRVQGERDAYEASRPVYDRVDASRISACWLLPFDQQEFDSIWTR